MFTRRCGTKTAGAGAPAVFVHSIFSWGDDAEYGFAAQRPLADRYRLVLMDRRGYGGSPDVETSDFETDADDVIAVLGDLPGGAHLVGHGAGGLAAALAAGRRPDLVRSLTLIQPSIFDAAREHPAVAALYERVRDGGPGAVADLTPEQYLRVSMESVGLPVPEATPRRLRAAATGMRERPVWEATVPLEPIRSAPWPTLVIRGTWDDAPSAYHELVGVPLIAAADSVATAVGARTLHIPGFYPHTQHPTAVNAALRTLWR